MPDVQMPGWRNRLGLPDIPLPGDGDVFHVNQTHECWDGEVVNVCPTYQYLGMVMLFMFTRLTHAGMVKSSMATGVGRMRIRLGMMGANLQTKAC